MLVIILLKCDKFLFQMWFLNKKEDPVEQSDGLESGLERTLRLGVKPVSGLTCQSLVQCPTQGWVSSGKNLFLPNLRFKPEYNGKNQNAGIVGRYVEHLFTAARVTLWWCACFEGIGWQRRGVGGRLTAATPWLRAWLTPWWCACCEGIGWQRRGWGVVWPLTYTVMMCLLWRHWPTVGRMSLHD